MLSLPDFRYAHIAHAEAGDEPSRTVMFFGQPDRPARLSGASVDRRHVSHVISITGAHRQHDDREI